MDFPSFEELRRRARNEALARNTKLTVAQIDRYGTETNIIYASLAAVGDEVIQQLAKVSKAFYLHTTRGRDLDLWVFGNCNGMLRKPASPSVGSVYFSTLTTNPTAFTIPVNTLLSTADGIQFITTAEVIFPSGSSGPVITSVRAVNAGIATQVAEDKITSVVGSITGAPTNLRVTNTLATAGGTEQETDDELKQRAYLYPSTLRRGTGPAIVAKALETPGVKSAQIFESTDIFGRPNKYTQLFITDAFTESLVRVAVVPAAYATQSQVLAQNVYASLSDTRAEGIYVDVRVAQVVIQPVQLILNFRAGVDVNDAALKARSAVVAYVNSLKPGSALLISGIKATLDTITELLENSSIVYSPAGDVTATQLQVIRTSLAFVSVISTSPDQGLQNSTISDSV